MLFGSVWVAAIGVALLAGATGETTLSETAPPVAMQSATEAAADEPATDDLPDDEAEAQRALREVHALLDAGDMAAARRDCQQIVFAYPRTDAASAAMRLARALDWVPRATRHYLPRFEAGARRTADEARAPAIKLEATTRCPDGRPVARYSLATGEKLRLHLLERVDFIATMMAYGTAMGTGYGLIATTSWTYYGSQTYYRVDGAAVAAGAFAGGLAALVTAAIYGSVAEPDRGDFPLVLSIMGYAPTTAALIAGAADLSLVAGGALIAVTGTAAIPAALIAAHYFDLDPGDTQLVRDAGFWGLAIASGVAAAVSAASSPYYPWFQADLQVVAGVGLVGLYTGLGLGLLAASQSDLSHERVRVITWAGYAGAAVGPVVGLAAGDGAVGLATSAAVAAVALLVGYLATSSLDELPPGARLAP